MARKKSDFQTAAEYYAARFVLSALGVLPRKIAVGVGLAAARIGHLFLGKLKRVGLQNTKIAFPEMPETEREKLVRGCFTSLGRQLGEVSQFHKATPQSLSKLVEFPTMDERWKRAEASKNAGRGVIVLTPHLGGWEIFALAMSAIFGAQSYLVRRLDNRRLEEMIERLRGRFGNAPIDKMNAAAPALAVLRGGGNLGILADINVQRREGVFVPFFNVAACTTVGVAALVMRTNALVVTLSTAWDAEKNKYVVNLGDVLEFERSGDRERDMIDFTARFTASIERLIRKNPEQWMWIHKRWKTRPEGEAEIY